MTPEEIRRKKQITDEAERKKFYSSASNPTDGAESFSDLLGKKAMSPKVRAKGGFGPLIDVAGKAIEAILFKDIADNRDSFMEKVKSPISLKILEDYYSYDSDVRDELAKGIRKETGSSLADSYLKLDKQMFEKIRDEELKYDQDLGVSSSDNDEIQSELDKMPNREEYDGMRLYKNNQEKYKYYATRDSRDPLDKFSSRRRKEDGDEPLSDIGYEY